MRLLFFCLFCLYLWPGEAKANSDECPSYIQNAPTFIINFLSQNTVSHYTAPPRWVECATSLKIKNNSINPFEIYVSAQWIEKRGHPHKAANLFNQILLTNPELAAETLAKYALQKNNHDKAKHLYKYFILSDYFPKYFKNKDQCIGKMKAIDIKNHNQYFDHSKSWALSLCSKSKTDLYNLAHDYYYNSHDPLDHKMAWVIIHGIGYIIPEDEYGDLERKIFALERIIDKAVN